MKSLFSAILLFLIASPVLAQTRADKASILAATHKVVATNATIGSPRFVGNFARLTVSLPGSDAATVYLKGDHGQWRVIAGPGTGWSPEEMKRLNIPAGLR